MNQVVIKLIGSYSYQTTHCLGEGVYGKVYEGMERETKEKVAIKKVDLNTFTNDKYLQNAIFSQIYLLKRFNHPNIVKFKDVLSSKNSLYIITEFCKHGDLKQMIKRKRFKDEEAFEVVRQIVCGFNALVQEKIVHRDLKPANILIHDGVYKIADFGFAKYVDNFGSQMLKSCVGSPIYMAPQVLQRTPYTTKCDIWSIGVIFYEMLFGSPPWKARDEAELIKGVKTIPISSIIKKQQLSARATEFLKKALAYSEEERFSWSELFEMFMVKPDKNMFSIDDGASSTSELPPRSLRNNTVMIGPRSLTPPNNRNSKQKGELKNIPFPHSSNQKSKQSTVSSIPSTSTSSATPTISSSFEPLRKMRDELTYKYFTCTQLLVNFPSVKDYLTDIYKFDKFIYLLALTTKLRNAQTLNVLGLCLKLGKQYEDLHFKMAKDQENYDEIERDIQEQLESDTLTKKIKEDLNLNKDFKGDIPDDKIVKLEQMLLDSALQNATLLASELRKRVKFIKDSLSIQILEWMTDVINLCLNKDKGVQEVSLMVKNDDLDIGLQDYLGKVNSRLERLLSIAV